MYIALLPLIIFIVAIVFLNTYVAKQNKQKRQVLVDAFGDKFVFYKKYIKAEVFTSGRKNTSLIFNACHIYTTDDALFIFGYKDLGVFTIDIAPIIITNNSNHYYSASVVKPKKFNPHSFNQDVYIEFGESGWQTTNVEIRLKGLTNDEKQYLSFLQ